MIMIMGLHDHQSNKFSSLLSLPPSHPSPLPLPPFLSLSPLFPLSLTDTLKGMYESSGKLPDTTPDAIKSAIREAVNMSQVPSTDAQTLLFAGITFATSLPVLLTFQLGSKVTVNSAKMVINSVLLKTIKEAVGHS